MKSFGLKRVIQLLLSLDTFLLLLLLYLRYTRSIQCLSKLSSLLFVSLSVEKWFSQFFLKIIQFIDVGPKERRETLNRWRELEKKKKKEKKGASRSTNEWQIDFVRLLPFSTPSIRARGMRSISSRVINNI